MPFSQTRYFAPKRYQSGEFKAKIEQAINQVGRSATNAASFDIDQTLSSGVIKRKERARISELETVTDLGSQPLEIVARFMGKQNDPLYFSVSNFHDTVKLTAGANTEECVGDIFKALISALQLQEVSNPSDYLTKTPQAQEESDYILPLLTSYNFHPRVTAVATKLYEDGHYRDAILNTYIDLIDAVKTKAALTSSVLDGVQLMEHVLSPKKPILKVSAIHDEQLGAMWLFSGAVMFIRNPKAHKLSQHPSWEEALEWLGFASALFRVLDQAQRV